MSPVDWNRGQIAGKFGQLSLTKSLMVSLSAFFSVCLVLGLTGCGSIIHEEYVYSAPYTEAVVINADTEGEDVRTYSQLQSLLGDMVNNGESEGKLLFNNYSGSVQEDMAAVCYEIKTLTPVGAYAVEDLRYELSRIVSYYTADISIEYKRTPEEIRDVATVNGVTALSRRMYQTLSARTEHDVLKVYSSAVDEDYFQNLVHQICLEYPLICESEPVLTVTAYPREGYNHIYDITLDYHISGSDFQVQKVSAEDALITLCSSYSGAGEAQAALGSAQKLAALCVYEEGEKDGSAYQALLEGRSDSRGFALAYKAICDCLGIECMVVEGTLGTLGGTVHYWNIIALGEDYYHVDVSRLQTEYPGYVFLLRDNDAWGEYIWNVDQYPACTGTLRYEDLEAQEQEIGSYREKVRTGAAADSDLSVTAATETTETGTEQQ